MKLKIIYNEPAAVVGEWLIISDLHLGGPGSVDWKATVQVVDGLMERERKRHLLILGDVKSPVASTSGEAGKFIREIGSKYDLHITKGNHDGNIEKYAGYCTVYGAGGAILCRDGIIEPKEAVGRRLSSCIGVLHGHAWPARELVQCGMVMIGHIHPSLIFGKEWKRKEKVWIFGRLNTEAVGEHYGKGVKVNKNIRLVCMPAFSPSSYSTREGRERALSPLTSENIFIKSSAEIYLLNGIRAR